MQQQPFIGNDSEQFQQTAGSPQTTQTNLQPTGDTTNQDTNDTGLTQQNLPPVNNLKVIVVQESAGSQIPSGLTPVQAAQQSWVGPLWGIIILLIIAGTAFIVRLTLKKDDPELSEKIEAAVKEPAPTEEQTKPKKATAKPKKKKSRKKRKKR